MAYLFTCVRGLCTRSTQETARRTRTRATGDLLATETWSRTPWRIGSRPGSIDGSQLLPAEQREVVVLKIWGGLTFQAIGEVFSDCREPSLGLSRYTLTLRRTAGNQFNQRARTIRRPGSPTWLTAPATAFQRTCPANPLPTQRRRSHRADPPAALHSLGARGGRLHPGRRAVDLAGASRRRAVPARIKTLPTRFTSGSVGTASRTKAGGNPDRLRLADRTDRQGRVPRFETR